MNNKIETITWNQNRNIKRDYNITTYYLNPLYLFKGLMYRYTESINSNNYLIIDDWTPSFRKEGSVFEGFSSLIYITNPKNIDDERNWGTEQGDRESRLITGWSIYNSANVIDEEGWKSIDSNSGGVSTEIEITKKGLYTIELPISVEKGEITVSIQSNNNKIYNLLTSFDDDKFFKSREFYEKPGKVKLYLYNDGPSKFRFDSNSVYLNEVTNDFKDKIKINKIQ